MLGPDDPLPGRPHRVLIAGGSGSGKTTLAQRVSSALSLPHTELDSLFHGPGWTVRETFLADAQQIIDQPRWVSEWQYGAVRARFAERADLMVWLDLPRRTVMTQVIRRTVRRRIRRQQLWNENLEGPLWTFFTNREHVIRWAWQSHPGIGPKVIAVRNQRPGLPIVRLTSRAEVERWCGGALSTVKPIS